MSDFDQSSFVITATSALTAIGPDSKQTCAAIKAGIIPLVEHAYFTCTPEDPEWDENLPCYVATVPLISPFVKGEERFTDLAKPALTEVFANSKLKRADLSKTGLFIALPIVDKSTATFALNEGWIAELQRQTGLGGLAATKIVRAGHVGVFILIQEAMQRINAGELDQCIIGGVDTYLLDERIKYFDEQWRIKSTRNVDGFIPGEAASMLLLERKGMAEKRGVKPLATLLNIGQGHENNSFQSQLVSTGQGLADSIKQVISGTSNTTSSVHCDFNGESFYAQEWGLMHSRFINIFNQIDVFNHPAESYGEVGAASGTLLCVNAIYNEQANGTGNALLATVNDDGQHYTMLINVHS